MADWQIIQSDEFSELPPEAPPPAWRRRGWGLLVGGLVLILALVGLGSLWRQRAAGRATLAEDLNAVIFAEESHRALGRFEPELVQAEASPDWQRAYRRSYEPQAAPLSESTAVSLASIDDFDGQCALATIAHAPHDPVRAYCLAETGWQRAPIAPAAWGDESELEPRPGLRLRFRERDRVFAERLAADLAGLSDRLPLAGLEIVLAPHDLAGPLILAEAGRIVLNSPELLPNSAGPAAELDAPESARLLAVLSGPEAVRLALGRLLLNRLNQFRPAPIPHLPGAGRFTAAARTVTAMRLLLDPAAQARLRQSWQTELAGRWVSPFFAGMLPQGNRYSPVQAEAAALLAADFIYQRHGPEALPHLLARLPDAVSWNEIFGDLPKHSTLPAGDGSSTTLQEVSEQSYASLLLEIEVAHYAQADQTALAGLYREYSRPLARTPLAARLRYLDHRPHSQSAHFPSPPFFLGPTAPLFNWPYRDDRLQGWRLYVDQPDQAGLLLIESQPDLSLTTPDGLPLSPGCLGPGAELAIEGDWLEAPRRFQASRIVVQDAPRLALPAAPAESQAYLLLETAESLAASTQFAGSGAGGRLVALQADGKLRSLFSLDQTMQLFPLPAAGAEPPHFLIQSDAPNCRRSWLGHYEPAHGLTGHWFAPTGPVEWVWRSDRAEPLFVKGSDNSRRYQFYEAGGLEVFRWQNSSSYAFTFMGWQPASRRLVSVGYRTYGTILGLLDPAGGELTWLASPPAHALRTLGLSPAGDWLAYPTGLPSLFGPSSQVYFLHLERPGPPSPLRLADGTSLAGLVWSPYLEQPALALLAGPIAADYTIRANQLLWADPARPEAYLTVAQAGPDEQFAAPVFCRNGDLLYIAEQAGRYELRRQPPTASAQTLLSLTQPFRPLACP